MSVYMARDAHPRFLSSALSAANCCQTCQKSPGMVCLAGAAHLSAAAFPWNAQSSPGSSCGKFSACALIFKTATR